jgi:hypothetical protein
MSGLVVSSRDFVSADDGGTARPNPGLIVISGAFDVPATGAVPEGCREAGCEALGTIRCAYADSRGRACGTSWCARHAQTVGDGRYCRRHASTVAALSGRALDPRALPPVDHRGASLVNWICTEGFSTLHAAVLSGARPGEIVFEDRSVNVVRFADGRRRWERGWRIANRVGIACRVIICVYESDDALVSLEVGDEAVAVGVPPWVTRRRAGQEVAAEVDAGDRAQFYRFLDRHIRRALAQRA